MVDAPVLGTGAFGVGVRVSSPPKKDTYLSVFFSVHRRLVVVDFVEINNRVSQGILDLYGSHFICSPTIQAFSRPLINFLREVFCFESSIMPVLNMLASVDKYSFKEDAVNDIQYSIKLTVAEW